MSRDEAVALLAAAEVVRFATTTPDGAPVLRAVNAVVCDGRLAFHGAPVGEKIDTLGRAAVFEADEVVASVPSYFSDPERACPATTLYRSVQLHGALEELTDRDAKARVLQALMKKYQPEGGHVPISADHPLYRKAVDGVAVLAVSLERLDGKAKLAQNRRPEEVAKLLELLWRRGAPGDARAVDLVRAHNPLARPAFLACPEGARLLCAPTQVDEAAALLRDSYWNVGVPDERIARAQLGATAWVGAADERGRLVATARAISDGAKWAAVFDVMIAPEWRGRGLGEAVMRLLLDHPAVRSARRVWLGTRDAQTFYARFGFVEGRMIPPRPFATTEMVLTRET
jgi:nitroimidazol reductase NimA-like FMN-containing flavoprotein (pyridoxamine 5'-phosphate oxidase superfamily)/GNAT superfamily N-acetyltransferase